MTNDPSTAWKARFQRCLLKWFRAHARDLPWRRSRDAYGVWISEIMLQQTQVATVISYFQRFMERFPDVASLAAADEQEVLRLWEGLGYYRRARQLHAAAKRIVEWHGGRFPEEFERVRELPGIGRYTAGAILSISGDQRLPILEANTIRLYCRLLGYDEDPTRAEGQRRLWEFAERILPRKEVGDFNQALMELGSGVCTPRQPRCDVCPVASLCAAFLTGRQHQVPVPKRRPQYEERSEAAVVIRRRGLVLLRRCGPDERWAGLWDFPRFEVRVEREGPAASELCDKVARMTGLQIEPGARLTTLRHGVTRYRITLYCHEATVLSGRLRPGEPLRWLAPRQLEEVPLSVTGRRIGRLLHAGGRAPD